MTAQLSLARTRAQVDLSKVLYRFQKIGANYLYCRDRALLADQMGLGKSLESLAALRSDEAAVIVCPASLVQNWKDEAARWRPDLVVQDKLWPHPGGIFVTSYNRVPEAAEDEKGFPRWGGDAPFGPTTLILDEAHYCKTSKSNRTRNVRALAGVCARAWLLTGTPLLNRPPELWALLQACKYSGKRVFGSYDHFVYLFDGTRTKYGMTWGPNIKPEARELLDRFMLRRTREEVLPELPTKTYRDIVVPIEKRGLLGQDFHYIDTWSDERVLDACGSGEGEGDGANIGALSSVRAELAEAKHKALFETLDAYDEVEEPLVVFSAHRACIDAIRGRPRAAVITGGDAPKDRAAAVAAFQDGHLNIIAGTLGAMGVGLTLTRASHALFVDESYVPAENFQAQDRLCRIGQTRGVVITRLVADHPVDKRVAAILERKRKMLEGSGLQ